MAQHYFNSKMVGEVLKWSLATTRMTLSSEIERTNEACENVLGPNLNIFRLTEYSNLLCLLAAGGLFYSVNKLMDGTHEREGEPDPEKNNTTIQHVKDPMTPDRMSPGVNKSSSEDDLSLNCLLIIATPKKFLKRPLYDQRQRGNTSRFKSILTGQTMVKTNTITNPCPRCVQGICRIKKHHTEQEIKQSGQSNRSDGDGLEELEINYEEMLKVGSLGEENFRHYRPTSKLFTRGVPDGRDILDLSPLVRSIASSRCSTPGVEHLQDPHYPSMQNMVDNAREVQRLIRESTFDSLTSDYSLDFGQPLSIESAKGEMDPGSEEFLQYNRVPRKRTTSVLSDFSDQSSTDWESKLKSWEDLRPYKLALGLGASYVQSESGDEAWEWDNDGYYEELGLDNHKELDILQQNPYPCLPNYVSELDLEMELSPKESLTDQSTAEVPPSVC